ncbi:DUF1643 domain-containing protein [[Brevibacterium] frigoritolerans]|nr:DUF1643 domain-containing protein [Peribacillus frigoritolerans]
MKKNAIFDLTSTYRYSLTRGWDENKGKVVFIMLNPSIANKEEDDKTTKRCIFFAKNFGFGSLEIVNLFAYISTNFNELKNLKKEVAIGPENEKYLNKALNSAETIIAAWGENCTIHNRHHDITGLFHEYLIYRLGTPTKDGYPRHPLYLRKDTLLQEYLIPNNLEEIITRPSSIGKNKGKERLLKVDEKTGKSQLLCKICHEEYSIDGTNVCIKCVEMLVGKYKQGVL